MVFAFIAQYPPMRVSGLVLHCRSNHTRIANPAPEQTATKPITNPRMKRYSMAYRLKSKQTTFDVFCRSTPQAHVCRSIAP